MLLLTVCTWLGVWESELDEDVDDPISVWLALSVELHDSVDVTDGELVDVRLGAELKDRLGEQLEVGVGVPLNARLGVELEVTVAVLVEVELGVPVGELVPVELARPLRLCDTVAPWEVWAWLSVCVLLNAGPPVSLCVCEGVGVCVPLAVGPPVLVWVWDEESICVGDEVIVQLEDLDKLAACDPVTVELADGVCVLLGVVDVVIEGDVDALQPTIDRSSTRNV
jgi:hypothetical protein